MANNKKLVSGLSLNTKLCAIASFFVDVSSEMVFPILPFFLTQILGAPVFAVGLIEGIGELVSNIINMLSGFYSDKLGKRKWFVVAGYSLSGLMKGFLVFVSSWWQVLVIRSVERFGKGMRGAPRDSLIALSESEDNIGKAIGFRKMMDNAGAVIGPLLSSILLALILDGGAEMAYKMIFEVGAIIAIIAVIATIFLQEKKTEPQKIHKILLTLSHDKEYKYLLYASAIFALGQFSIMLFILGAGVYISIIFIPVVYLAYNVFYTIFAMPAGRMADKIGARRTLLFGWTLFLLILVGFALFANNLSIYLLFAMLGLFMAINETAPRILINKMIVKEQYASALGSYNGVTGVVSLAANVIAGAVWGITIYSIQLPFLFAIATTVISIFVLIFFIKSQPKGGRLSLTQYPEST